MTGATFTACRRCGRCCRVQGYVRLRPGEAACIAGRLDLSIDDFTARFTRLTRDRSALSLTEQEDGSCTFLGPGGCAIHDVKPQQCRDFPLLWRFDGWQEICAGASQS
jgi:uncharacterized protein